MEFLYSMLYRWITNPERKSANCKLALAAAIVVHIPSSRAPASAGGDVIIKPLGGTGHQGLVFNYPNGNGNYLAFGNESEIWMKFLTDNTINTVKINGKLFAREIEVSTTFWSDFVFKPDYKLMPLNELESFIKENTIYPIYQPKPK